MQHTRLVYPVTIALALTGVAMLLLGSCGDDGRVGPIYTTLYASSVTHGGCTMFAAADSPGVAGPTETCVTFSYDGRDTLRIERINACFNCCPDSIVIRPEQIGSMIILRELDVLESGGCHCLCLYDLAYAIGGIAPGEYLLTVAGPYEQHDYMEQVLQATVDLRHTPSGTFCVERFDYPWGNAKIFQTDEFIPDRR